MTKPDTGGRGEGRSSDLVMVEREVLEAAHEALSRCYDVNDWPADGTTRQDAALRLLTSALQSVEGGVQVAAKQESCPESATRTETAIAERIASAISNLHEQKFGEKLYRDDALDLAWAAIDATKSDGGVVADTPSNETATEVMAHPSPMGSRSCDEKTIACGVAGVAPGPSEHYRVPTNCVCCHGPLDHNRQCPICDFAPGPSDSAPNHQPHAVSQGTSPELLALIERAKSHVMTPEEQYEQRRSFVRGMCPFNRDYASWCAEVDRLLPPLASPAKTGGNRG
jgi:hypothetical protein